MREYAGIVDARPLAEGLRDLIPRLYIAALVVFTGLVGGD